MNTYKDEKKKARDAMADLLESAKQSAVGLANCKKKFEDALRNSSAFQDAQLAAGEGAEFLNRKFKEARKNAAYAKARDTVESCVKDLSACKKKATEEIEKVLPRLPSDPKKKKAALGKFLYDAAAKGAADSLLKTCGAVAEDCPSL